MGLLLANGVPLKLISEVVGHSSIALTGDTYGKLAEKVKVEVEAANAMDRALSGFGGQSGVKRLEASRNLPTSAAFSLLFRKPVVSKRTDLAPRTGRRHRS